MSVYLSWCNVISRHNKLFYKAEIKNKIVLVLNLFYKFILIKKLILEIFYIIGEKQGMK